MVCYLIFVNVRLFFTILLKLQKFIYIKDLTTGTRISEQYLTKNVDLNYSSTFIRV